MADIGELLKGIAATMWVLLAFIALWFLRGALSAKVPFLTKLGVSPTGLLMEFAEQKLDEAAKKGDQETTRVVGEVAKRTVLNRLRRNADLLERARILWVDDHPENNTPIVELLQRFGTRADTPRSNDVALSLLQSTAYDVIISDVGRDNEGTNSALKGVEFAEEVFARWRQPVLLFTARFDPTQLPNATDKERLDLTRRVQVATFARTKGYDEALHYILDVLERRKL